VPRFWAEQGRPPNQRGLATLQEQATLRTRRGKDGVIDWDAATRGRQAKAARKAGVDLASLYRQVSRLEQVVMALDHQQLQAVENGEGPA
jgi:hypothetical protein